MVGVTLGELVLSQQTPYVWSVDDRNRLVPAKLAKAFPTGIKPAYRMKLASGLEIDATANHPFLTIEGWARLDSLSPDGFVAVPDDYRLRSSKDQSGRTTNWCCWRTCWVTVR